MYWQPSDYQKMAKLVIDIYKDYNITHFPVNLKEVCNKLGIALIPYSSYSKENRKLLMKRSTDGFFIPYLRGNPPMIFYNDNICSEGRKRFTGFHEIKHIINGDKTEGDIYDEGMADFFSKYFMCPTPYLIAKNITNANIIISTFNVSDEVAYYISNSVKNRISKYGYSIFEYEMPLLKQLLTEEEYKDMEGRVKKL